MGQEWATRAREPNFDPERPRKGGWAFAAQTIPQEEGGTFGVGVNQIDTIGDRLEWEVDVPVDSEYIVWMRYGHLMKDEFKWTMDDRTVFGVVNGTEASLTDMPYSGAAGYINTRWGKTTTLRIPAGRQTLYWQNAGGGALYLDAFVLCDDPDWNPDEAVKIDDTGEHTLEAPVAGKHAVLVQAEMCSEASGKNITVGVPNPIVTRDRLIMDADAFPDWDSWEGAELHIFPAMGWLSTILPIHGTENERTSLLVDSTQDIRSGNRFFIAGTRAALDSPGEWHLDKDTGQLLYWPVEEDFPSLDVVAPVLDRLVMLEGTDDAYVEHIHFRGLTFIDSRYTLGHTYRPADAAFRFAKARHCTLKENTFTRLGGYAAIIEQRSYSNTIAHNTMNDLGQGGVIMLGDTETQAHDNLVVANTIMDIGLIYKHVGGVYVTTGSGNRIAHNRIHRTPRYGISTKSINADSFSHNNLIEFNELIDTNLETCDTGAIETLGRDEHDTGNIIRYNLIRNVVGMNTSPEGEIKSPYFTWGIYLDDYSSGTTVYGNIVDGTDFGGFMTHGGRNNRIENNIFLNASSDQLRLQPRDDFMANIAFKNNIVAYQDPETRLWKSSTRLWSPSLFSECDYNVYWCYGDPEIASSDRDITPEGRFADWLEAGLDKHSVVADPGFVSADLTHFGLKPDSPAFALGFRPIPEERIGPEGYLGE